MKLGSSFRVVLPVLLLLITALANDEAPKITSLFKDGRWSVLKYNGYRFVLCLNNNIRSDSINVDGFFRLYYDSTKWRGDDKDETSEGFILRSKKNKSVLLTIGVTDKEISEHQIRDNFESSLVNSGFQFKSKKHGSDLINGRIFRTVFYVLNKNKDDNIAYTMFYSSKKMTIVLTQSCRAVDHMNVYNDLFELVSGLEIDDLD